MSPEHQILIRRTWAEVAPRSSEMVHRFYEVLFDLEPGARALFGRSDRGALERKLAATLSEIVRVADDPERLVTVLAPLGRQHAGCGVTAAHYEAGAAALLAALRDTWGEGFGTEAERAWRELYRLVAAVMGRAPGS